MKAAQLESKTQVIIYHRVSKLQNSRVRAIDILNSIGGENKFNFHPRGLKFMFETKIIISPKHANYDANMCNENKNILPRTLLLKLTGKTLKSNCIACPLMACSLTMTFCQNRIELSTPRTATDIALCVVALLEWGKRIGSPWITESGSVQKITGERSPWR